eukprot:CCRYP_018156-RE/>CCRYP_018156-RE protein AED:0.41 eAED:0.43 QI:0/0.5/0.66/1/0/0/3/142/89
MQAIMESLCGVVWWVKRGLGGGGVELGSPPTRIQQICHATFHSNSLRGLEYSSTKAADLRGVAVVPRKMVLGVSYPDEDDDERRTWDIK